MGVDQDRGQGVVDLVGDPGGHLAQGTQLLGLEQVILHLPQLLGPLLHPLLQRLSPLDEVLVGQLEVFGHLVEGVGQLADFVPEADPDLMVEVSLGDPVGGQDMRRRDR